MYTAAHQEIFHAIEEDGQYEPPDATLCEIERALELSRKFDLDSDTSLYTKQAFRFQYGERSIFFRTR